MDARQAKAALSCRINKTDANDAEGLAQLLRTGFFRPVRVKSKGPCWSARCLSARRQLVRTGLDLANQIRGLLKIFGLLLPRGGGRLFEAAVRERLAGQQQLTVVIMPLLQVWRAVRTQVLALDRLAYAVAKRDPSCRRLLTAPGRRDDHGAGLRRGGRATGGVQERPSGQRLGRADAGPLPIRADRHAGRISRQGDMHLRTYLYEAANTVLTRSRADTAIKRWGLALKARVGHKRAVVAVASKLAVVLHAMWAKGAAVQDRRRHGRRMSGDDRRSPPPRGGVTSLPGRRRDHHDMPAAAARTAFMRQSEIPSRTPSCGWL